MPKRVSGWQAVSCKASQELILTPGASRGTPTPIGRGNRPRVQRTRAVPMGHV
jgi:hypothetical protein